MRLTNPTIINTLLMYFLYIYTHTCRYIYMYTHTHKLGSILLEWFIKHAVFTSLYLCSFCYLFLQWFLSILLFIKYFLSIYSVPGFMLSLGDSVMILFAVYFCHLFFYLLVFAHAIPFGCNVLLILQIYV